MSGSKGSSGKGRQSVRMPATKFAKLRKRMDKRRVERWLTCRDRRVK